MCFMWDKGVFWRKIQDIDLWVIKYESILWVIEYEEEFHLNYIGGRAGEPWPCESMPLAKWKNIIFCQIIRNFTKIFLLRSRLRWHFAWARLVWLLLSPRAQRFSVRIGIEFDRVHRTLRPRPQQVEKFIKEEWAKLNNIVIF